MCPVATSLLDGRAVPVRRRRVPAAAGLGIRRRWPIPTIQILTLYPGEPGRDDLLGHRAARAPVRPDPRDLNQMSSTSSGGSLGDHPAVRARFEHRRRGAGGTGRAQRSPAIRRRPTCRTPPVDSKVNPADAPVLDPGGDVETMPLPKVQDLVDTRLAQKISQLPGIGLVTITGGQRPAVRIQANTAALTSLGLSLDDLRTAIGNANVNTPGSFNGAAQASSVDANDELPLGRRLRADSSSATRTARRIRLAGRRTGDRRRGECASRRLGPTPGRRWW